MAVSNEPLEISMWNFTRDNFTYKYCITCFSDVKNYEMVMVEM